MANIIEMHKLAQRLRRDAQESNWPEYAKTMLQAAQELEEEVKNCGLLSELTPRRTG